MFQCKSVSYNLRPEKEAFRLTTVFSKVLIILFLGLTFLSSTCSLFLDVWFLVRTSLIQSQAEVVERLWLISVCFFGTAKKWIGDQLGRMEVFFQLGRKIIFYPECLVKSHYNFRVDMLFGSNGIGDGCCKNIDVQVWLWKKLRWGEQYEFQIYFTQALGLRNSFL